MPLQSNAAREDRLGELRGGSLYDPARTVQRELHGAVGRQTEMAANFDESRWGQARRNDGDAEKWLSARCFAARIFRANSIIASPSAVMVTE